MEYELLDTGIFDEDRYFDIFIEYAKASPEDICIRLEAVNRGPEPAELHCIPQLWFRNNWPHNSSGRGKPRISLPILARELLCCARTRDPDAVGESAVPLRLKNTYLQGPPSGEALFTDNESRDSASSRKYAKDGFHRFIIHGEPMR